MKHICPKCEGELGEVEAIDDTRYAACGRCQIVVEVETRTDPCKQLCDNCAFRPNSPERQDPYQWMRIWERAIEDGLQFSCHKGEIANLNGTTVSYQYPEPAARKPCAGWLANRKAYLAREAAECL